MFVCRLPLQTYPLPLGAYRRDNRDMEPPLLQPLWISGISPWEPSSLKSPGLRKTQCILCHCTKHVGSVLHVTELNPIQLIPWAHQVLGLSSVSLGLTSVSPEMQPSSYCRQLCFKESKQVHFS